MVREPVATILVIQPELAKLKINQLTYRGYKGLYNERKVVDLWLVGVCHLATLRFYQTLVLIVESGWGLGRRGTNGYMVTFVCVFIHTYSPRSNTNFRHPYRTGLAVRNAGQLARASRQAPPTHPPTRHDPYIQLPTYTKTPTCVWLYKPPPSPSNRADLPPLPLDYVIMIRSDSRTAVLKVTPDQMLTRSRPTDFVALWRHLVAFWPTRLSHATPSQTL